MWRLRERKLPTCILSCVVLLSLVGCSTMWRRVAERERLFAVEAARVQVRRGQCVDALASLDRAEAGIEIGLYAREAIGARARCYEELGLREMARAHRQLLADFHGSAPMAESVSGRPSILRVEEERSRELGPPPSWLRIEAPRYSRYARRSKIVGRVVVSFDLGRDGRPTRIRVLETPHPLLASWAIEAIARSGPEKNRKPVFVPGLRYVSGFDFQWRWAE